MFLPGRSLSAMTAWATSSRISVEFCHCAPVSVVDTTYFALAFRCVAKGSSLGAVGQCRAKIS